MPTRRRSEQLTEMLVECPVPQAEAPDSHIELVRERLTEIDAAQLQLVQSPDAWARRLS